MKKFTLVLIASTVALGATQANISTGFYAGGAVGYGGTTGKSSVTRANLNPGTIDVGGVSQNIGIHAGYGLVYNCFYLGGEAGYTFDPSKVNDTTFEGFPGTGGGVFLKRTGYYNIAARGGYLLTPGTMVYVRLGANGSNWTFRDNGNPNGPFSSNTPGTGSNNRLSFTPGLGLETAINPDLYLRAEYTYEFGPTIRATNNNLPGNFTQMSTIRSQSGKIGLSHKFLSNAVNVTYARDHVAIENGFYAGAALGYGITTGKYAITNTIPGTAVPGSVDLGGNSGNIGIHGGYGIIYNCFYVGGEIAATYDNIHFNDNNGIGLGNTLPGINGGTQIKRNGYFNAALRGGYMVTPATMAYLRLGANWSKWTLRDAGNNDTGFTGSFVGTGTRTSVAFVPGVGLETAVRKNVYLRLEYTYEFCPGVTAVNNNFGNITGYTSIFNLRNQSGKAGLSYKF